MIETEAVLRRWGRSLGVVIPMQKIREGQLRENEKINIILSKKENPLEKHFGKFKFKKSTAQMLKESDKEAWDE